jgi:hypothetical protein
VVAPRIVVHCFSEDSGKGVSVICALVRRILVRMVEPKANTTALSVLPADPAHTPAVAANAWLSKHPRDQAKITELNKYIARLLTTRDDRFKLVFHHFDADVAWGKGDRCEKQLRWEKVVRGAVAQLAGEEAARRLVAMVPHPEIESWLYSNAGELAALAKKEHKTAPHPPPGGWDHCGGVKDECPWPGDAHNMQLAGSLQPEEIRRLSPSFAGLIRIIEGIPGAKEALEATRGEGG